MSKCKQCVCEQICRFNDGHNLYCKEDYECPHYKSAADMVEVVRCKDCIYAFMTIGRGAVQYCDMFESDDGVFFDKNHYCSYGERKKN